MTNLVLWDCSAHQQPSACCSTQNMGQGRIYLISFRVIADFAVKCRVRLNSSLTSILMSFFFLFYTTKTYLFNTCRLVHLKNLCGIKQKKWQELVYEEDIFEHSSLTLTCGSILWDCSSPQAAIWKSRDKWRYAGRGTSGLFGVCTDRKCDGWEIYTQLGPDMDLYFGLYRPAKRAHYYMPLAGLFVCHA